MQANISAVNRANAGHKVINAVAERPTTILDIASAIMRLHNTNLLMDIVNNYRHDDI
jgi:nucleoside-diphosphate-sugar epimerase